MYVPPYIFVLNMLGLKQGNVDDNDQIRIPLKLLKMFLQIAVSAEKFDESLYLKTYSDIEAAVQNNIFDSGSRHYLSVGYFEGRHNPAVEFDEKWYKDYYSEVLEDIRAGKADSPLSHYILIGRLKGLVPNKKLLAQMQFWKNMF